MMAPKSEVCMMMRKSYSNEFKLKAASMVLDEDQPIPETCASLDIGPTALRRWLSRCEKSAPDRRLPVPRRSPSTRSKSRNLKLCSGRKTGISKS
ncbi:transposase [Pseudomonas sp. Hz4]